MDRMEATLPAMGRIGWSLLEDKFNFESTSKSVESAINASSDSI
jgi:hypothetical protein